MTATVVQMLAQYLQAKLKVLLVGPPGIGKTAIIHAVARMGYDVIAVQRNKETDAYEVMVMRASLSERIDFGGALVPDVKAGITRELPLEKIAKLMSSSVPTVLFLDDLGQAPIDVQAALMRFFDNGTLPPNVVIWGATNRPADKAGVMGLVEPLRSRFDMAFEMPTPDSVESPDGATHLCTWKELGDSWCAWASSQDVPEVVAWHRASGNYRTLYQWKVNANPALRMADFRTWESLIKAWKAGIKDLKSVSAIVGKAVATEFLGFLKFQSEIATPDQVRNDPLKAHIPVNASAIYLTVSMLANACTRKDVKKFTQYGNRLDRTFAALLFTDLRRKLDKELSGDPTWTAWLLENQEMFI